MVRNFVKSLGYAKEMRKSERNDVRKVGRDITYFCYASVIACTLSLVAMVCLLTTAVIVYLHGNTFDAYRLMLGECFPWILFLTCYYITKPKISGFCYMYEKLM